MRIRSFQYFIVQWIWCIYFFWQQKSIFTAGSKVVSFGREIARAHCFRPGFRLDFILNLTPKYRQQKTMTSLFFDAVPNLLLAFSNFTVFLPLVTAHAANDLITWYCIAFVGFASFISHLFESHKHGMWGFGVGAWWSWVLNRFDVLGVGLVTARMSWLIWTRIEGQREDCCIIRDAPMVMWAILEEIGVSISIGFLVALLLLFLSESSHSPETKWSRYIPAHCAWHLSVFYLLHLCLLSLYSPSSSCWWQQ